MPTVSRILPSRRSSATTPYKQIRANPTRLRLLGDGRQRKSHLWDCIGAILHAMIHAPHEVNIVNLGTNEHCEATDSRVRDHRI